MHRGPRRAARSGRSDQLGSRPTDRSRGTLRRRGQRMRRADTSTDSEGRDTRMVYEAELCVRLQSGGAGVRETIVIR
jgi:hypothetical protein